MRKALSHSEGAYESRLCFLRASLGSDFWLSIRQRNEEKLQILSVLNHNRGFQLGSIQCWMTRERSHSSLNVGVRSFLPLYMGMSL